MWNTNLKNGVIDSIPLIYFFQIFTPKCERRYIGIATSKVRLYQAYRNNVQRIFEGKQKRGNGPLTRDGRPQKRSNLEYRRVHLFLAVAVENKWPIIHTAIENGTKDEVKARELVLIEELNSDLNSRFGQPRQGWLIEEYADLKSKVIAGEI
ncbi:hypothetical protein IMCC20628_04525 [Hoeflea sp. IMCC20628]|nr:hypothetical protein IMCC20628_04525 [Hoeflea sp. IMCC20628]